MTQPPMSRGGPSIEDLARALCRLDRQDPDRRLDGAPIWERYVQDASRAIDALALLDEQPDLFGAAA